MRIAAACRQIYQRMSLSQTVFQIGASLFQIQPVCISILQLKAFRRLAYPEEQVNEELVSAQEASVITIVDADCVNWEIDMLAADIRPDYSDALKAYLKKNASAFWMDNLNSSSFTCSMDFPVQYTPLIQVFTGKLLR